MLAELARQEDARLRAALIALFLQQPNLSTVLPRALERLSLRKQLTLKIYFTAAVILQDDCKDVLRGCLSNWRPLPDLYSAELGVDSNGDAGQRLRQLGRMHARLTGLRLNWPGTYRHAAEHFVRRLRLEEKWVA